MSVDTQNIDATVLSTGQSEPDSISVEILSFHPTLRCVKLTIKIDYVHAHVHMCKFIYLYMVVLLHSHIVYCNDI